MEINKANRAHAVFMAQNAHQWEVEDLKKAGLNPILSAGGTGASGVAPSAIAMQPTVSSSTAELRASSLQRAIDTVISLSSAREAKANADIAESNATVSKAEASRAEGSKAFYDNPWVRKYLPWVQGSAEILGRVFGFNVGAKLGPATQVSRTYNTNNYVRGR